MENFTIKISEKFFTAAQKKEQFDIMLVNNSTVKKYEIGNRLKIENRDDKTQQFEGEIVNILYFDEIYDVLGMVSKQDLGFSERKTATQIEDKLLENVKYEDVEKYGVVLVEIKKI